MAAGHRTLALCHDENDAEDEHDEAEGELRMVLGSLGVRRESLSSSVSFI
jgi:hypothetical protein